MADVFPSLQPSSGMEALMQMLVNMQRQGAIETAAVGPTLGQGIETGLQGFQRQGELGRQRTFADEQARKQRDFYRRQAQDRYSVTGARERRTEQEQKRQFGITQKNVGEQRLRDDLAAMERIAQSDREAGVQSPPEFMESLNALRKRVLGFQGGPPAGPETPGKLSKALAEGASGRIGPPQGLDFSRGPMGTMKPSPSRPAAKPGDASRMFQSKQWAGFVASDPSVRAAVRGMPGVAPKRPEAAFYAKAAEALKANRAAGFPLTKAEIVEQLQDEIRKGAPSIEGIQKESIEPTPYLWSANESVIDPRTKERFVNLRDLGQTLGGELTTHPSSSRNALGGVFRKGPVFIKRTGEAAIRKHPAFSDDVMTAVIDQLAAELGYGPE